MSVVDGLDTFNNSVCGHALMSGAPTTLGRDDLPGLAETCWDSDRIASRMVLRRPPCPRLLWRMGPAMPSMARANVRLQTDSEGENCELKSRCGYYHRPELQIDMVYFVPNRRESDPSDRQEQHSLAIACAWGSQWLHLKAQHTLALRWNVWNIFPRPNVDSQVWEAG